MKYLLFLAIGIIIGSCIGIVVMCMLQINTGRNKQENTENTKGNEEKIDL